ncbi:MAG: LacI family DNA-binding transcriptional regulator [Anaerolineaceae bacterium]|nr:LacI family DNA-binding transcriptional regulator [Anaerolineaceae bacterium]
MSKTHPKTLDDIARLANVSTATVSRALSDSPLISKETKERIQAIAQKYQYRINISARNLRLRQSKTIAFVAPVYTPEFFSGNDLFGMEMLSGIGRGLHDLGYDLLVIHVDADDITWSQSYLESGRVDGFILLTSDHKPSVIKSLVETEVAFIGWGHPIAGLNYCSVTGDNLTGGNLATQHLLKLNRKRIAFLGGPKDSVTIQHRQKGYQMAIQSAGIEVNPNLVAYTNYSYESGGAAMRELLRKNPDLNAVFVTSDLNAIGAINAIHESGKRVPEDIAVVGYDDLPIALYNNLPLTTIRQNFPLIGKLLAENLIQYLQTGVINNVITPVELIIRKSA